MKSRVLSTVILSLLLLAPFAFAQPAPEPTPPPPPPPLWEGKLGLGYAATSGNSSTSTLTTGLEAFYRPLPWTIRAKFDYLRASSEGVLTAESLVALLAGIRDLNELVDVFAQAGYERNVFSGLDDRVGGEAGAGFKLLRGPQVLLRTDVAFGYRHESRTDGTTLNYPSGRAGFKVTWKFGKGADVTDEFSWTDDLSNTSNWILRNTVSVTAAMTSLLSLKASYGVVDANEPVPGFKKVDTVTSVALVAKF